MLIKTSLKNYRVKAKLTQEELAKKLHVKQYTISDYETGRIEPSIVFLIRFADYFHITLDELCSHTQKKKANVDDKEEYVTLDKYTLEFSKKIENLSEGKKKKLMNTINFTLDTYLQPKKTKDNN